MNRLTTYRLTCICLTSFHLLSSSCQQTSTGQQIKHIHSVPGYNYELKVIADKLVINAADDVVLNTNTFNFKEIGQKQYLGFTDNLSKTYNLYDLSTRQRIKQIKLPATDDEMQHSYYAHFHDFDSIFVVASFYNKLMLLDTMGNSKVIANLVPKNTEFTAQSRLSNYAPAVTKDNKLYFQAFPNITSKKPENMKLWKSLFEVDLSSGSANLLLNFPEIYHKHLFGPAFLFFGYCFDGKNWVVRSYKL